MRARIAGKWARPIEVMAPEIKLAAEMLAECGPDLLVYNCTASSMREGPVGERKIIDLIKDATGIDTVSTSAVISEAFKVQGITSVVVISPYPNNDEITGYLEATGIKVARSVALNLPTSQYGAVTPEKWREVARENDVKEADGIFLSCAATTQIEAVAGVEADLGKPVVNSNQAVLWGALRRLKGKLGSLEPMPQLGSLMTKF
jgi:maleate cis-trans isomerase